MMKDQLNASAASAGALGMLLGLGEQAHAHGMYKAVVRGYREDQRDRFLKLHARREALLREVKDRKAKGVPVPFFLETDAQGIALEMDALCEDKARHEFPNLVTTAGKNFLLDNGLAGSAYTAAFYMGLISSTSYSAVAAGDTMASHAGWLEAGGTNAPTYSGARKTAAWAAASAGSKSLSAGLVFTFTGAGTVKGCFLTTSSAVDATTGTLYSAGLFTGGDQPVVATNTLTVTYTASL